MVTIGGNNTLYYIIDHDGQTAQLQSMNAAKPVKTKAEMSAISHYKGKL